MSPFILPELGFAPDALEPFLDEQTMILHHDRHHQAYVTNLNRALKEDPTITYLSLEELLLHLDRLPQSIRLAVRNHGGGHYNHSLFWKLLSPGGHTQPTAALSAAITEEFGSFDAFKEQFSAAAAALFGSGWAWLSLDVHGHLSISASPNQDNPLMDGNYPLLGLDVWEHAYYLNYQNRRPEYIENVFKLINWSEVSRRYDQAIAQSSIEKVR